MKLNYMYILREKERLLLTFFLNFFSIISIYYINIAKCNLNLSIFYNQFIEKENNYNKIKHYICIKVHLSF
jgi:hypothetical protein